MQKEGLEPGPASEKGSEKETTNIWTDTVLQKRKTYQDALLG